MSNINTLIYQAQFNSYIICFQLTYDIIHEYAADNVKYLEIRSTPKDIPETGMTWELYIDTMLRAVRDCQSEHLDIVVCVLISIDRRRGVDVATKTVCIAEEYLRNSDGIVVGIDLSGDPAVSVCVRLCCVCFVEVLESN